ncbi:hypothetical protein [Bradyrhizobium japonicum]|uniref:hypothetical protein n=1 Tax=Bradyrhizobium japonicum TaxID=375 RepID=UPI001FDA5BD9|nr:hypothetical protein [Bradyrhizobium japonicum]
MSDDIARLDADTPAGSIAKDMAIANARMVRTNLIDDRLAFRGRNVFLLTYPEASGAR